MAFVSLSCTLLILLATTNSATLNKRGASDGGVTKPEADGLTKPEVNGSTKPEPNGSTKPKADYAVGMRKRDASSDSLTKRKAGSERKIAELNVYELEEEDQFPYAYYGTNNGNNM